MARRVGKQRVQSERAVPTHTVQRRSTEGPPSKTRSGGTSRARVTCARHMRTSHAQRVHVTARKPAGVARRRPRKRNSAGGGEELRVRRRPDALRRRGRVSRSRLDRTRPPPGRLRRSRLPAGLKRPSGIASTMEIPFQL